jgi:hypothetical protein
LASSFATSQRVETLPFLQVDGTYESRVVRYIDSARLRERLTAQHIDADTHGIGAEPAAHIQIYLFSLGSERPILVDKHFQAKAVASDMIVAVQCNVRRFESRIAANGKLLTVDLRDPLRATLEQSGVVLGGLIPAHISYDAGQHTAKQNWQWAVGTRPTARLSHPAFARFGQLCSDTAQRNALEAALSESERIGVAQQRRIEAAAHSLRWRSSLAAEHWKPIELILLR